MSWQTLRLLPTFIGNDNEQFTLLVKPSRRPLLRPFSRKLIALANKQDRYSVLLGIETENETDASLLQVRGGAYAMTHVFSGSLRSFARLLAGITDLLYASMKNLHSLALASFKEPKECQNLLKGEHCFEKHLLL